MRTTTPPAKWLLAALAAIAAVAFVAFALAQAAGLLASANE